LRLNSQYEIHGLGSRLDGEDTFPNGMTDNAFRSLASNHFDSWAVGLSLNVPIGYRAAYASIRAARLRLTEGSWQLPDQGDRATRRTGGPGSGPWNTARCSSPTTRFKAGARSGEPTVSSSGRKSSSSRPARKPPT